MDTAAFQKKVNEMIKEYYGSAGWMLYSADRLSRLGGQIYMKQHGIFTRHSRQMWANVVGMCPEAEVRRYIVRENLYEEEGIEEKSHFLKLVTCGEAVGLTKDEIVHAEALPTTRASLLIWETLTKNRHWLIGAAAKSALELASTPECGSASHVQGQLWMSKLGLTREQAAFWVIHDELDSIHGGGAFDLVLKYLGQQNIVAEADILRAVEDSTMAMKIFMDGIAVAADAADATNLSVRRATTGKAAV